MEELKKVIRNGKVAILYSKGYGAGWYSWNTRYPQCIFSPEIVDLVEKNEIYKIDKEYCDKLFGVDDNESFYSGGADGLTIEWLPIGTHFDIDEYDGAESVKTFYDIKLIA